jgi:dolichol-phosphate mannosyltransferase
MRFTNRVKRFFIIGLSAAFVNLAFMVLFVEVFGFKTYFLKNLANILSIEISIIYNFILSRAWTWKDVPQKKGMNLIKQCGSFHLANFAGMGVRAIMFAVLERLGVFYVLNVVLGIVVVATMSFILYDRIVFKRMMDDQP